MRELPKSPKKRACSQAKEQEAKGRSSKDSATSKQQPIYRVKRSMLSCFDCLIVAWNLHEVKIDLFLRKKGALMWMQVGSNKGGVINLILLID